MTRSHHQQTIMISVLMHGRTANTLSPRGCKRRAITLMALMLPTGISLSAPRMVIANEMENHVGFNATNVIWTSDIDALVNITGNIWKLNAVIEKTHWALSLNGEMLIDGSLRTGDGNDSVNPQSFTEDDDA